MSEATVQLPPPAAKAFDVRKVRADFPILAQWIRERPVAFLDSAASAQKPRAVLDAERECYEEYYANVHRGVHHLSVRSTQAMEAARETAREFLGAPRVEEVIFVRGTTEGVNLVAATWGRTHVGEGDEVLITELEHHSNIVPWQMLCEDKGAVLRVAPIDDRGVVDMSAFADLVTERTKIVAVAHISNSLGTLNPVREMADLAHAVGAVVFVDGAQAAPHTPLDVEALGCDFYTFSGHKAFGPSGVGILWGKTALLEAMPPYQTGGEMILTVRFDKTEFNVIPHKFEAGTPSIAGAIGLGAALRYLMDLDRAGWAAHEAELLAETTRRLEARNDIRIIGTAPQKSALVSFVMDGVHAHDVGTILDEEGVAVRTGHHCAQPVMEHFGVAASVRASFALYNDMSDVDALMRGLDKVTEVFG
ncbi:MAG: cysteine desulfurase [Acidobacteriota bacterium]|nr:cysteine desulfurase [Acidobacteriota bacterium]